MRNKELLLRPILSYAQQIISSLLGLLCAPFLLSWLGQSEYGLYITVSAATAMISLMSLDGEDDNNVTKKIDNEKR